MQNLLWPSPLPPLFRCPLPSGLNRTPCPLSEPRLPQRPARLLFSSPRPLPENCPLSPASRSLLQGTCHLLAEPDGGSMVPAVFCVPLSVRRTFSPETLTSPAVLAGALLSFPLCAGPAPGQEHLAGSRGPGAGSLPRPRPLPPLSSFPPSWPPSPFPLCLYFYSLNSAESSAF